MVVARINKEAYIVDLKLREKIMKIDTHRPVLGFIRNSTLMLTRAGDG
jgi:hypothetical protein